MMIENKIKIAHETPLCLLKDSLVWNDYQYVLPTLWNKYDDYRNFILDYKENNNSFIILDNGLFEDDLRNDSELLYIINLIEPDIFITPDAWNDGSITFKNAVHWINDLKEQIPKDTHLMVVLQGTTFQEMLMLFHACYTIGYRYFAVNYSSISYQKEFPNNNLLISQMMGRIKFIHELKLFTEKWNFTDIYLHLLGASLPQEFVYYKDYNIINSIDTSNPLIVGALGQRYEDYGLLSKPKEKIEVFIEKNLDSQYSDIKFNIYKFKSFVNSKIVNENIIGQ